MMFDIDACNEKWNRAAADSYDPAAEELRDMAGKSGDIPGPAGDYFGDIAARMMNLLRLEQALGRGDLHRMDLSALQEMNSGLFDWKDPEKYAAGWADPARAVDAFGEKAGRLLSLLYYRVASGADAVFTRRRFQLAHTALTVSACFRSVAADGTFDEDVLSASVAEGMQMLSTVMDEPLLKASLDPGFRFYRDIMESMDPRDPRSLYRYGCRIGEHELRTAAFFAGYPGNELEKLARVIVDAFRRGFEAEGRELDRGSSIMVRIPVGYERLLGYITSIVEETGLHPVVHRPSTTEINRQANLDHRFDITLWIDDEYLERHLAGKDALMREHSYLAAKCSGIMAVTFFGEKPFSPVSKPQAIRPGDAEMERFRRYQNGMTAIQEKYMPRSRMSFTVISFPSPEIGERFEEIFDATVRMNSVDNETHLRLQQSLIEILDGAESIHIEGRGGNRTDLTVALQQPEDLETCTAFRNCLADVNIPVGEVFTSPGLTGTGGILHVEQVMLNRMEFRDLEIEFHDGMATGYTCSNFDTPGEGEKFVREQLFFPHEELPAGEFAIGTNTLAYEMAMKFGIMDLLPVLIIEKMGPHLAIGDTCYAHEEDRVVRNPDGREVVARDNEKTLARTEDPEEAYTNTHIDISIPYHMIRSISAVFPDGSSLEIIRDGRFVPGELEELNAPIDRLGL